jgi:type I restriction enzyme S subunit
VSKWERVRLGSINNYQSSSITPMTEPNKIFELYSVPSFENNYPEIIKGAEIGSSKVRVQKGDVLLCKINPRINRVWSVTQYTEFEQIASTEWIVIRNDNVFTNYLVWCLKSQPFRNLMTTNVTGIGGSLTRVQPKQVYEYKIPLPPLKTQKQIAKTLDTASELLRMRKKQLAELDGLIKSVFYDMFGDPVTNEKGWNTYPVEKTIKFLEAGWSVDGEQRIKEINETAVLKVSAVTSGYFRETEYKVLDKNKEIKKYVFPHKGDLLFSRANTRELVGATCVIFDDYPDLILPDKLWRIEFNAYANSFFMKNLLSDESIRLSLSNISTGTSGSMFNVSMEKLKSLKVPVPPIELQTQFASIVTKIEEQKALVKKAIDETQYLLDSLMSRYFD